MANVSQNTGKGEQVEWSEIRLKKIFKNLMSYLNGVQ